MLRLVTCAVLLSVLAIGNPAQAAEREQSGRCGVERWSVKVLTDTTAGTINFIPRGSAVSALRALPVPSGYDKNAVDRYPAERQVYRVRAVLVGWKKEADRDFHIVIADPGDSSATMIVEPPDPACSTSPKANLFGKVRAAFVKCFGQPTPRFVHFPAMTVDVTGVLYFDPIHGQTGVAPNGVELHPLLSVKTVSGTCPQ